MHEGDKSRQISCPNTQTVTVAIHQSGDTTTEDESECEERQRLIGDNSLSEQSEKTNTDSAEAPAPTTAAEGASASSALKPSAQRVSLNRWDRERAFCHSLIVPRRIAKLSDDVSYVSS